MRDYLQYVIAALGLTTAIAASIFIGQINEKTGFPEPIIVDGRTIEFTWTDDNANENLLIYTDKATYSDGLTHAEVYVAVENTTNENQAIELMAYFRDNKKRIKDVSVLTTVSERTNLATYQSVCSPNDEPATTTKRGNDKREDTICTDIQTSTSTTVTERNLWVPINIPNRDTVEIAKEATSLRSQARKPVETFTADRKTESHYVPIGSVAYFKVLIEFPANADDNFYFEAIGDRGGYGHLDPWFNASWDYRVSITVDDTKVPTTQTSFPVYVDLSDLPADFHTNVKSDGCDIRVVEADETTETAFELVEYDSATDTGELHFMADSLTGSGGGDTTFYIYYGNSGASCYAAGDTYGRNAVWTAYEAVWHLHEDPSASAPQIVDSTGNGNTGTSVGTMTSGDSVAGQLSGNALDLDGTDDYISFADSVTLGDVFDSYTTEWVMNAWFKSGAGTFPWLQANKFGSVGWVFGNISTTQIDVHARQTASLEDRMRGGTNYISGTWRKLTWQNSNTQTAGDFVFYVDGSLETTTTVENGGTMTIANSDAFELGFRTDIYSSGQFDEVRLRLGTVSADWETTEYNNQSDPGTFYAVGAQEANTPPPSTGAKQDVFWF